MKIPSCFNTTLSRFVFFDTSKMPLCLHSIEGGKCITKPASSTNSQTWLCFDAMQSLINSKEKREKLEAAGIKGVGVVLYESQPLVAVDLDKAIKGGKITSWANKILSHVPRGAYVETSPSGTGLHVFVRGQKSQDKCKRYIKRKDTGEEVGCIEIYDSKRYMTLTNRSIPIDNCIPQTFEEIASAKDNIEVIEWIQYIETVVSGESVKPQNEAPIQPQTTQQQSYVAPQYSSQLTKEEVLEKLRLAKNGDAFFSLYNGITSQYPSESEAFYALVGYLTFYTSDRGIIDSIVTDSSLYRGSKKWCEGGKWDRLKGVIIDTILDKRTTYYGKDVVDYYNKIQPNNTVIAREFTPLQEDVARLQAQTITNTISDSDETLEPGLSQAEKDQIMRGMSIYDLHIKLFLKLYPYGHKRDLFTDTLYVRTRPANNKYGSEWVNAMSDSVFKPYRAEVEIKGKPYKKTQCEDYLAKFTSSLAPELLIDVPEWDGKDRIREMTSCLTMKDSRMTEQMVYEIFKDWGAKMWGKVFSPNEYQNRVIVLNGEQGIGKDEWIESMLMALGNYKSDITINPHTVEQDFATILSSNMVVVISEFDKTNKIDVATFKDLITRRSFNFRAPYERAPRRYYNRGSIIAACNPDKVLRDTTANRRFIVLKLKGGAGEAIKWTYPRNNYQYSMQLIAQWYHLYKEMQQLPPDKRKLTSFETEETIKILEAEYTPKSLAASALEMFDSMIKDKLEELNKEYTKSSNFFTSYHNNYILSDTDKEVNDIKKYITDALDISYSNLNYVIRESKYIAKTRDGYNVKIVYALPEYIDACNDEDSEETTKLTRFSEREIENAKSKLNK